MLKKRYFIIILVISFLLSNLIPATSLDGPSKEFFIDPYTGQNNCMIIVGENAAASDAMSAAWIAAQIGTMSYYEDTKEIYTFNEMTYYTNDGTYNKMNTNTGVGDQESKLYVDNASTEDSTKAVLPFQNLNSNYWDYDIYVDPYSRFEEMETNWLVDTGFSYETITADLSVKDTSEFQDVIAQGSPATKQSSINAEKLELSASQSYPAIYPRHYWGSMGEDKHDPLGGLQYRVIAYGIHDLTETKEAFGTIVNEDQSEIIFNQKVIDLYTGGGSLYFLGETYNCLSFGTDQSGYDYMLYGIPNWKEDEMKSNAKYEFDNGWDLSIRRIDIYNASISIELVNDDGIVGHYDIKTGESLIVKDEFLPGFSTSILCIELENITLKDTPTATLSFYSLNEYGIIKETIYGMDKPFISYNELEWHLDIVPGGGVQDIDIDNDPLLFQKGNPSFDISDNLMLYSSAIDETLFVPYMELWLSTPIETNEGGISISFSNDGENEYFHIDISDNNNKDLIIDDYIKIGRTVKQTMVDRHYIDIESSSLVIKDIDVNVDIKSDYNLILVGGPVVNELVRELIILNITESELWNDSPGEFILFRDAFVNGKDVIVVAGKDREATNKAAKYLLNYLTNL